eukprot:621891-Hanusia_phi.AAC.2
MDLPSERCRARGIQDKAKARSEGRRGCRPAAPKPQGGSSEIPQQTRGGRATHFFIPCPRLLDCPSQLL